MRIELSFLDFRTNFNSQQFFCLQLQLVKTVWVFVHISKVGKNEWALTCKTFELSLMKSALWSCLIKLSISKQYMCYSNMFSVNKNVKYSFSVYIKFTDVMILQFLLKQFFRDASLWSNSDIRQLLPILMTKIVSYTASNCCRLIFIEIQTCKLFQVPS